MSAASGEWCDALNHFAQAVQIACKYYPWPEDFDNEVDTLLSRCVGSIGGQISDRVGGREHDRKARTIARVAREIVR